MKQSKVGNPIVLMIDDDAEDIYLMKRAFCSHDDNIDFRSVKSGADLFDYLHRRGAYSSNTADDTPDAILLDINIPKVDGFTLLQKLKETPEYSHLPVTMLTTSTSGSDVRKAYQLGASSFICKPPNVDGMKSIAEKFCGYWFGCVELPHA